MTDGAVIKKEALRTMMQNDLSGKDVGKRCACASRADGQGPKPCLYPTGMARMGKFF